MRGEPKSFQELYDEKYFVKDPPPPQQAPPPKNIPTRVEKFAPIQPSPTNSYQSASSSLAPSKDEKKKKRGLFRFG
jgi:syntaxin-binding protein 1